MMNPRGKWKMRSCRDKRKKAMSQKTGYVLCVEFIKLNCDKFFCLKDAPLCSKIWRCVFMCCIVETTASCHLSLQDTRKPLFYQTQWIWTFCDTSFPWAHGVDQSVDIWVALKQNILIQCPELNKKCNTFNGYNGTCICFNGN